MGIGMGCAPHNIMPHPMMMGGGIEHQQMMARMMVGGYQAASYVGPGSEPLIKSCEALWLIRYNELLNVSNHVLLFTLQLMNLTSDLLLIPQNSFVQSMAIVVSLTAILPIENCHGGS